MKVGYAWANGLWQAEGRAPEIRVLLSKAVITACQQALQVYLMHACICMAENSADQQTTKRCDLGAFRQCVGFQKQRS